MIKSWCWLIHPERAIIMNRTGLSTLAMSSVHYRQTSDVRPRCDEKSTRSSFRSIRHGRPKGVPKNIPDPGLFEPNPPSLSCITSTVAPEHPGDDPDLRSETIGLEQK